jgi:hypothetical protein
MIEAQPVIFARPVEPAAQMPGPRRAEFARRFAGRVIAVALSSAGAAMEPIMMRA